MVLNNEIIVRIAIHKVTNKQSGVWTGINKLPTMISFNLKITIMIKQLYIARRVAVIDMSQEGIQIIPIDKDELKMLITVLREYWSSLINKAGFLSLG